MEGRGRDVGDQLRSGEREVGRRRPRLPDVLADRGADERPPVLEQEQVLAGREVAILVEDAVVRQEALAVARLHLAARADRARVEEVALEERPAHERDDVPRRARDLVQRALRRADEARPQQQVLRRIPRDDELGEEDEVGTGVLRFVEPPEYPVAVAVEVADDRVHLREREPHRPPVFDSESKTTVAAGLALQSDRVQVVLADLVRAPDQVVDVVVLGVDVPPRQRVGAT